VLLANALFKHKEFHTLKDEWLVQGLVPPVMMGWVGGRERFRVSLLSTTTTATMMAKTYRKRYAFAMRSTSSYRQTLRELAYDTHGVITVADAREAGVPPVELRKLTARGALRRIGHGVYRMIEAPSNTLDEFAEAVALGGEEAVLADESVLAAHGLGQVNLRQIRVATPRRVRSRLPNTVAIEQRKVPLWDRDYIEGIPAMGVESALLGSRGRIMTERLVDAARKAEQRGLLDPVAAARVIRELEKS
jgi:predicted transcriptional regulator of viral defense system